MMSNMNMHRSKTALTRSAKRFWQDQDGSTTVESIIWFPIFAILLAFTMNLSMVYFSESQMLRVTQDANRSYSLGRMDGALEVEEYIAAELAYLGADLSITTVISGGFITTDLSTSARDLMPLNFMTQAFEGVAIAIRAQHIIEF